MSTAAPKVSVGVPTYNRGAHLGHAIGQILAQDFTDFELLIFDDASTDDTTQVVGTFDDPRVLYTRNETNQKIPGNLNRILAKARGEYIVILHDHDSFHPTLLSRMVRVLDTHPSAAFVFSGIGWTDHLGGDYREFIEDLPEKFTGRELVRSMLLSKDFACPINACGMVRRAAYDSVGGRFDDRFGFVSDVDMWFHLGMHFDIGYVASPLIVCRSREPGHEFGSLNWKLVQWLIEIQRVNLERYCTGSPEEREILEKALETKTNGILRASMLRAIASGDYSQWQTGVECLKKYATGLLRHVTRVMHASPAALVNLVLVGARYGNTWRHQRRSLSRPA